MRNSDGVSSETIPLWKLNIVIFETLNCRKHSKMDNIILCGCRSSITSNQNKENNGCHM